MFVYSMAGVSAESEWMWVCGCVFAYSHACKHEGISRDFVYAE